RPYLPGVEILVSARRDYLYGPLFAHTIGYVGEISEAELAREGEFGPYRPGSLVGKSGLERVLEADLRGVDGGTQVEVDAYGRILRELGSLPGSPGASVTLTIDLDLQQAMAEAYEGREGAAVALDPRNGEILAMYSAPSFDPAVFLRVLRPEEWAALSGDPHKPLENKAMRGEYPPGSVFKIVTALAGFQTGALDVNRGVHCSGALHFGGRRFGCWRKGGHGGVDFIASLARSCDVYYYTLGLKIGVNAIADTARALGLGRATGVDLPGEREGNIPTREWKKRRFGEPWYDGETLPVAIGQGYVTATPLQIAVMGAAVANGGTVYAPHLVRETADPSGEDVRRIAPKAMSRLRVDEKAIHLVHEALRAVVNEPGGTGSRAKLPGVQVAGKTGTAQVVGLRREEGKPAPKIEDIPYE
ncbi:MAG: penicillin-binding protein 2, partial [Candidatus Methylomirabilis sp.]|nr:penicillin-binding protein 2 [Deltaproteobacteria bacterium]